LGVLFKFHHGVHTFYESEMMCERSFIDLTNQIENFTIVLIWKTSVSCKETIISRGSLWYTPLVFLEEFIHLVK
jgi:hypothetical protein